MQVDAPLLAASAAGGAPPVFSKDPSLAEFAEKRSGGVSSLLAILSVLLPTIGLQCASGLRSTELQITSCTHNFSVDGVFDGDGPFSREPEPVNVSLCVQYNNQSCSKTSPGWMTMLKADDYNTWYWIAMTLVMLLSIRTKVHALQLQQRRAMRLLSFGVYIR
jgi:hypothetical protein